MTDNVTILPVITRLPLPCDRILNGALAADLDLVVVLGWTKDGDSYFASSTADGGEVMWLMELLKKDLLDVEL